MPSLGLESAIQAFFFGMGMFAAFKIVRFVEGLLSAKRESEIKTIELEQLAIKNLHERTSTEELIDAANNRNKTEK